MTDIATASPDVPSDASVAPADRQVTVTRTIDAPRALVWKAWTEPEHVVRWWGPAGCQSVDCEIDLRVGGRFRLVMHTSDGSVYPCSGVFREIVPFERLVYDGEPDGPHACGAGMPPRACVTVTFDEQDGKTVLTVETRFDTVAACQAATATGYAEGWPDSLERLADHLTTH